MVTLFVKVSWSLFRHLGASRDKMLESWGYFDDRLGCPKRYSGQAQLSWRIWRTLSHRFKKLPHTGSRSGSRVCGVTGILPLWCGYNDVIVTGDLHAGKRHKIARKNDYLLQHPKIYYLFSNKLKWEQSIPQPRMRVAGFSFPVNIIQDKRYLELNH